MTASATPHYKWLVASWSRMILLVLVLDFTNSGIMTLVSQSHSQPAVYLSNALKKQSPRSVFFLRHTPNGPQRNVSVFAIIQDVSSYRSRFCSPWLCLLRCLCPDGVIPSDSCVD